MDVKLKLLCARILMQSGYANAIDRETLCIRISKNHKTGYYQVRPFDDDLEGRRQFDAIKEELGKTHKLEGNISFSRLNWYSRDYELTRLEYSLNKILDENNE